jgi:hypothetical protein
MQYFSFHVIAQFQITIAIPEAQQAKTVNRTHVDVAI